MGVISPEAQREDVARDLYTRRDFKGSPAGFPEFFLSFLFLFRVLLYCYSLLLSVLQFFYLYKSNLSVGMSKSSGRLPCRKRNALSEKKRMSQQKEEAERWVPIES